MKEFKTSIGKYNVSITFTKQKYLDRFTFNVLPTFKIRYSKYTTWNCVELFFEWFLYSVCIFFDNYED